MHRLICDGEPAATVEFFDQSAEEYYAMGEFVGYLIGPEPG